MTEPDRNDLALNNNEKASLLLKKSKKNTHIWGICSLSEVKKNLCKLTNIDNINFIKGPVEETLEDESNLPEKISLLRLDTDWYSSTKKELEKAENAYRFALKTNPMNQHNHHYHQT